MGSNNTVKKLIENALRQHHKDSLLPREEQWFTRAAIAKQMKAPSGGLNPSRKGALHDLVIDGVVEERQASPDGKQTWSYRIK